MGPAVGLPGMKRGPAQAGSTCPSPAGTFATPQGDQSSQWWLEAPFSPVLRIGCGDGLYEQGRKRGPRFTSVQAVGYGAQEETGDELQASGWGMNVRLELDMALVVSCRRCGLRSRPPRPQQPWVPGPSECWCCGEKVGAPGCLVPKPVQEVPAAGLAAAAPAGPELRLVGASWWPLELPFVSPRRFHLSVQ